MPERTTFIRAGLAILAVSLVSLLFIGSYAGALHNPRPHDVPIAVPADAPAAIGQRLDASPAFEVVEVADREDALRAIDERDAYGAVLFSPTGLTLVVSPASSAAVAQFLRQELAPRLQASGLPVTEETVNPLPESEGRGLVGFYTAIGWVVAGYLGATLLGLAFGPTTGRRDVAWRLAALAVLGIVVGLGGAVISHGVANYDHGFLGLVLIGILTVLAVGSTTLALQTLLGVLGTGVAILIFVVIGNPSAGGAYAGELLPGLWRTLGQLIPTGAATTSIRNVTYFPDASIGGPLAVFAVWLAASSAVGFGFAGRGKEMSDEERRASAGAVAA